MKKKTSLTIIVSAFLLIYISGFFILNNKVPMSIDFPDSSCVSGTDCPEYSGYYTTCQVSVCKYIEICKTYENYNHEAQCKISFSKLFTKEGIEEYLNHNKDLILLLMGVVVIVLFSYWRIRK